MNDKFDPEVVGKETRFSATNQPGNAGRKKNLLNYLKEDYHLSQSDVDNFINYIEMMPIEEYDLLVKKVKDRDESIKRMPKLLADLISVADKAKLDDIIKILKASGKATDKSELSVPEGIEIIYTNKTKVEEKN